MATTYLYMHDIGVSFEGFSYSKEGDNPYWKGETNILQPQLEKMGYTVVRWINGESDSFGPMSRVAVCTKDNKKYYIWYG